jgi:thiamine-monophosphate kinase
MMAESEFEIIRRYFTPHGPRRDDVLAGVGDDAAIVRVPPDRDLVLCMDTLVAGVHFPVATEPAAIGHKALAVNLSDLAAMGAEPAWATLALTLPESDGAWLERFSRGFLELAERYRLQLIGGDLSRGPLSITVEAHGFVVPGKAMRRRGARPGDLVCVTGSLGDAGLALELGEQAPARLRRRLEYPEPRIAAGLVLREHASAAIDVSDGLLADLAHLLEPDGLGAALQIDALPRSPEFTAALPAGPRGDALSLDLPLSGGDDYELCFCLPQGLQAPVAALLGAVSCALTPVGVIEAQPGIRCYYPDGRRYSPRATGYQHFGHEGR